MPKNIFWPLGAAALTNGAHTDRPSLQPMLRTDAVMALCGLSRSTLELWVQQGRFPKPVKLGPKIRAWCYADIESWLASRTVDGAKEGA